MGRRISSHPLVGIWVVATSLALVVHLPASAQTSRGAVTGTVTDISAAVIGRAEVLLTNTETGVIRSTFTNDAGIYRFDAVDLGTYTLKVTKPGFRPFLSTGVGVEANRATTLDAKLGNAGDKSNAGDEGGGQTGRFLIFYLRWLGWPVS